jgi:hypothetical protein
VRQVSGLTLQPNTKFTILAPSDYAFATRLKQSLNMTAQELLKPENRDTLVKVGAGCCCWALSQFIHQLHAMLSRYNVPHRGRDLSELSFQLCI